LNNNNKKGVLKNKATAMPPKGKDVKKGVPVGNYKAGKPLKDILPATSKPPREGQPLNSEL
jgi:hypothetical protein